MIQNVWTAIRAWVELEKRPHKHKAKRKAVPFRPQPYGWRVLVFDLETTVDHVQRLLFGFFRLYENDRLVREGIIAADVLDIQAMDAIIEYSVKHHLPIYSREKFVEEIFYPEVYELGTLCVGFNLPFDLARIAISAGCGRGENRRKFRIVLSKRLRWHDLRIGSLSGRASLIAFVPKRPLYRWEKPFFSGRFCDLSATSSAFSGQRHSLRSAGKAFHAFTRKMKAPDLGTVDRHSLLYGRQDVRATWALYKVLRSEYARHPFATFENELHAPEGSRYIGQLYSSASIAKQYLRLLNIEPLLQKQPGFRREYLGRGAASYFGGRAEVRIRKLDVPVRVLDYTSMYPTIFCLQELQKLLTAPEIAAQIVTAEVTRLLREIAEPDGLARLYDRRIWRRLNCLVLVEPNGAILPSRFRAAEADPFTIAVTPLESSVPRWYTLADVIASVVLGGPAPKIRRAMRFVAKGRHHARSTLFRALVELRSDRPIFTTIVEEKQVAKARSKGKDDWAALAQGLKEMANSGAYGIHAEVNVQPSDPKEPLEGTVYSDIVFESPNVHDERPGDFANPIIASLITGGARLMLAMLEREVADRGGTFAFCDTDSLAIVCGEGCPAGIPQVPEAAIQEIVERFDALSPYDPEVIPHLLKIEYPSLSNLRCFAVSAKRYVLFRFHSGNRIEIVKASEAALGAIIGRSSEETTAKLARRIWLSILVKHLKVDSRQRKRMKPLIDFDLPMRRKFPINQPSILKRLKPFNKDRSYDYQMKPSGFVQTVVLAMIGSGNPTPIAPFESNAAKSKGLPWIDYRTGDPVRLDWMGTGMAGTLPVMRLSEYIDQYERHPEAKAADSNSDPAGPETVGLLGRLKVRSGPPRRIGKEIDRLDADEGASLDSTEPLAYEGGSLADEIAYLATFPQVPIAQAIGIDVRRWRDILKGRAQAREATAKSIVRVAQKQRLLLLASRLG